MKILFMIVLSALNVYSQQRLDQYIDYGQNNNADVQEAYDQWQGAMEDVSVVKKLPNPSISAGYFLENVETAVGPQEFKIGIMQKFPMFGKLSSVSRARSAQAEALKESYLQIRANVSAKIKSLYYDIYYLEQAIDITRQNVQLLENWEKVIQIKYKTAQAGHPDVINTQIELMKLQNVLESLKARKQPFLQSFRAVLNDNTLENVEIPDTLVVEWMDESRGSLLQKIQKHNHTLLASEYSVSSREDLLKRAKLNYLPDVGIGLDYIGTGEKEMGGVPVTDSGKDPLVFKVSLELPIWFGKNAKHVSAARYRKTAAESQLVSKQNSIYVDVESVLYKMDDARRKIDLYGNEMIPKSMESLGASEKAYISDKADLITLIDAQRRLLQFKLEYESAVVNYLQQKALLESYIGLEEGE
ncbi:MAG: TolC family protein [Candidatus Marinimicrobia bacterium]|jgi:outer membrane protein TolC|nr:TolC family protein [Candidatus Neomarinimicrobiota bacterium]MDP7165449.1 TolC family protein [Candidatus Neomarinimicrobiota bacterium]HJL62586.1 TolC family protein [Candidatus Neomarinimicrobiota bacterium]|tara:strand:+ start:1049 stop:2293 length:1245 start_codon:yes stop_codon:yes gene_type:complete